MTNITRCVEFGVVPRIYEDAPPKRILIQVDDIVSVRENTEDSCKISTRDGNTVSVYGSYDKVFEIIREMCTKEDNDGQD